MSFFLYINYQSLSESAEAAQQLQVIEGFQKAAEDIALLVNTYFIILQSESTA
jgi:hypothetical protein